MGGDAQGAFAGFELELIWPVAAVGVDRAWEERGRKTALACVAGRPEAFEWASDKLRTGLGEDLFGRWIMSVHGDSSLDERDPGRLGPDRPRVCGIYGSGPTHGTGIETVTRPLPLEEACEALERIAGICAGVGAFSNASCGFHANISFQGFPAPDYARLLANLDSDGILRRYGRSGCASCKDAGRLSVGVKGLAGAAGISSVKMAPLLRRLAEGEDFRDSEWGRAVYGRWMSLVKSNPKAFGVVPRASAVNGQEYVEYRLAGGEGYEEDAGALAGLARAYARAQYLSLRPLAPEPSIKRSNAPRF